MKQNWTCLDIPDLTNKTVIVTGANSGVGYQTALEFAKKNAIVWLACRNESRAQEAVKNIKEMVPHANIKIGILDLADLTCIHKFVDSVKKDSSVIDILVNNGGGMILGDRKETTYGSEYMMGSNYLGHYALTGLLLPLLKNSKNPRIVNLSAKASENAKLDFDDFEYKIKFSSMDAYARSKLATLLFTKELQRRSDEYKWNLIVTSAHPGFSDTGADKNWKLNVILKTLLKVSVKLLSQTEEQGAWCQEYAAVGDVIPNGFYGPGGFGGMKGHPKLIEPCKAAKSNESALKLWELSEKITAIKYDQ